MKNFLITIKKKVQIISSGHPKIDFLKKIAKKYFYSRKIQINKKYGKFILIATQFPFYNLNTIDIDKNPNHFPMFIKNYLSLNLVQLIKINLNFFYIKKKLFLHIKNYMNF